MKIKQLSNCKLALNCVCEVYWPLSVLWSLNKCATECTLEIAGLWVRFQQNSSKFGLSTAHYLIREDYFQQLVWLVSKYLGQLFINYILGRALFLY